MSVNSFDTYPMSWKPEKQRLESPLYLSLAAALEEAILSGRLAPHTKLPPQRELADFLDIGLSTITRAFAICEQKGLIYATTGRGTFVAPNAGSSIVIAEQAERFPAVEMGVLRPLDSFNDIVSETAKSVLSRGYGHTLLDYSYAIGMPYHIDSAKKWLTRYHVNLENSQIGITSGAQNTLMLSLTALFQPGDRIAVDQYTYSNFIVLAKLLHIQLVPIEGDAYGMLPESLAQQCSQSAIHGVYCIPSCNNPTAAMMDETRRRELAEVIRNYGLILLENDVYGFLLPEPIPPIQSFVPEQTIYIHTLSKSLCSGLRIAFAVFPERYAKPLINSMFSINIKAPALNTEILVEMINNGTAEEIISQKRQILKQRNRLYEQYFGKGEIHTNPYSFFRWLPLLHAMPMQDVERLAFEHGVSILHSERFLVTSSCHNARPYLRVSLCSPQTDAELEKGLRILKNLFAPEETADTSQKPII